MKTLNINTFVITFVCDTNTMPFSLRVFFVYSSLIFKYNIILSFNTCIAYYAACKSKSKLSSNDHENTFKGNVDICVQFGVFSLHNN